MRHARIPDPFLTRNEICSAGVVTSNSRVLLCDHVANLIRRRRDRPPEALNPRGFGEIAEVRWTISSFRGPVAAAAITVAAFSVAIALAPLGAHAQSGPVLGIDADATGNEPTALGQRDVCIEVQSGDTFSVDVTAENVTGLAAWEAYVSLDTEMVNVIDRDIQQMLASAPGANPFDVSESVPEEAGDNGLYRVGGANITEEPVGVDGSGVLARLTLEAAGPGVSTLSVRPVQTDAGSVGAVLTDADANHIGDADDDGFFDGAILDAQVAVDQDCPSDAEGPIAALTGGSGGDGVPSWVFALGAVGLVAAAGFGGMALIRMRRAGSRGTS